MARKKIISMKMISVYMPIEMWQAVQDAAEQEGISASCIIRKWIGKKVKVKND
jgi:hypothetical protein